MNMDDLLKNIGQKNIQEKKKPAPKVQMIHYSKLNPSDDNFYDTDDIEKLAAAIRLAGEVKNPIRVKKTDIDEYEINEGHRRRLAVIKCVEEYGLKDLEFVPCIVEKPDNLLNSINLILSNSTQRERTEHEKMLETQKLRELLNVYAEENDQKISSVEMRQLISDILGISKTKVAQLESINRNLIKEAKEKFEHDDLPVSVATEMASLPKEKQKHLIQKQDLKLSDVKNAKKKVYETRACSYVKNIECNIDEVIDKYFTKNGNVEGCAGCCKNCLNRKDCSHVCVVVKANNADLKDQMNIQDIEQKENKYFSEEEIVELTFSFSDVKKILGVCKKDIKHVLKNDKEQAVRLKIIISSLERLLKELVVRDNG